jgi:hypothetical protein
MSKRWLAFQRRGRDEKARAAFVNELERPQHLSRRFGVAN